MTERTDQDEQDIDTEPQEPGAQEPKAQEPEAEVLEPAVKSAEEELEEFKNKYFRALAEMENTRKRLYKEKIESQGFAIQNTLLDFLQPLDQFENALKHTDNATAEIQNWAIGFKMILEQFKQSLSSNGVVTFDSVGKTFDPMFHEAVETCETQEHEEGTIIEEFVRGYKMADRVIRPAKVKVATAPNKEVNNQQNEDTTEEHINE